MSTFLYAFISGRQEHCHLDLTLPVMDTEKKDVEEEPFSEELDLPGATIGVPVQPQATSALLIADDKSIRSASSMMRSLKLDGETMDAASRDRLCVTFGSAVNVVLVDRESSRPLLVTGRLPLQVESTGDESATSRFSQALADGVLMAHLAEALYPGSVPASLLDARLQSKIADTQNKNKRMFIVGSRLEQLFKVLAAAPFRISLAARTKVQDVVDGCGTSVLLELVWSLLAEHVIAHVDIDLHPQLVWLRDEGESLKPVLCARPEQLLVRWFNYHLKRAGSVR